MTVGFAWTRTAGFCPPVMLTNPTPGNCEIFGSQTRVGEVLDLRERKRVGGQRQRQDRRIRGVDLVIDRRRGKIRRQISARRR